MANTTNRNILIVLAIAGVMLFAFLVQIGAINLNPNANKQLGTYFIATITYSDGTHNTFTLPNNPSTLPLLIVDPNNGNKEVLSVVFDMYVTATFTGTISSWSISSSYYQMICPENIAISGAHLGTPDTTAYLWKGSSVSLMPTGTTLTSGTGTKVTSITVGVTGFLGFYTGWQSNTNYYWVITFPSLLSMTLTYNDGSTATQTTSVSSPTWNFQYRSPNSFTSLSVSWQSAAS